MAEQQWGRCLLGPFRNPQAYSKHRWMVTLLISDPHANQNRLSSHLVWLYFASTTTACPASEDKALDQRLVGVPSISDYACTLMFAHVVGMENIGVRNKQHPDDVYRGVLGGSRVYLASHAGQSFNTASEDVIELGILSQSTACPSVP
jgi:hypothetical protein